MSKDEFDRRYPPAKGQPIKESVVLPPQPPRPPIVPQ